MRYIGRLPTGDEFVVEVHLGWSVTVYFLTYLPVVGDVLVDIMRGL